MPEVQHVHIADTPLTASTNQHTVYSFHSQSLYEGEIDQNPDTTEVGVVELRPLTSTEVGVVELRPLTSTSSADANLRLDYVLGVGIFLVINFCSTFLAQWFE